MGCYYSVYCFRYLHLNSSCLSNDDGVEAWGVQILVYIGSVVLLWVKIRGHSKGLSTLKYKNCRFFAVEEQL